ncbi:hypothetical protein BVRB_4g078910 [Beta vulgaris subsp. vulgaris]|uniref:uncharacterized protein LOC104890588 n=1 Tax=Beta vulgaris subsp. vulgaris TaxID=3555 RepID=UPI00053FE655|nr:uncharacterized protein LOC104890588 [Beta vulgaris subsp. vulgaris]KMT14064.1 hypothetical protein BVRB_4g078910 [Beta vulgaris subsp. vulgaris]
MAVPENSKLGICYIWLISFILFVFTVSGAIFLLMYMIQPTSPTTSLYPVIGVSLISFPWFFWLLTILYRIVSRACGFRMSCFGSYGADHPDDRVPSGAPAINNGGGGGGSPVHNASIATTNGIGEVENGVNGDLENGNRNENGNGNRMSAVGSQPGSPRRVHFGGVVILGEDNGVAHENQGNPKPISSPRSSSSSSSSENCNESELPLRFSMAS